MELTQARMLQGCWEKNNYLLIWQFIRVLALPTWQKSLQFEDWPCWKLTTKELVSRSLRWSTQPWTMESLTGRPMEPQVVSSPHRLRNVRDAASRTAASEYTSRTARISANSLETNWEGGEGWHPKSMNCGALCFISAQWQKFKFFQIWWHQSVKLVVIGQHVKDPWKWPT